MGALQLLPTPTLTYHICSISSEKLAAESWGPYSYVLPIFQLLPTLSLLKNWQQSQGGLAVMYSLFSYSYSDLPHMLYLFWKASSRVMGALQLCTPYSPALKLYFFLAAGRRVTGLSSTLQYFYQCTSFEKLTAESCVPLHVYLLPLLMIPCTVIQLLSISSQRKNVLVNSFKI